MMDAVQAEKIIAKLAPQFPVVDEPWPLYHYTDGPGFHGILTEGRIRATHFQFVNDAQELIHGEAIVETVSKEMRDERGRDPVESALLETFLTAYEKRRLSKIAQVFVASFSQEPDLLSQWRAYSAQGTGYAIGFSWLPNPSREGARAGAPVGLGLVRCQYDVDGFRRQVKRELTTLLNALSPLHPPRDTDDPQWLAAFLALAHQHAGVLATQTKHPGFVEEREWRLIVLARSNDPVEYRPDARRGLVPYISIDLRPVCGLKPTVTHVVVGPTQDPSSSVAVTRAFLAKRGYSRAAVEQSRIPYRSF